jgi:hypothetical protein
LEQLPEFLDLSQGGLEPRAGVHDAVEDGQQAVRHLALLVAEPIEALQDRGIRDEPTNAWKTFDGSCPSISNWPTLRSLAKINYPIQCLGRMV